MSIELKSDINKIKCSGYAEIILKKMHDYRECQELCDVILIAGIDGIRVSAHRLVLSASSEYFATMFRVPMREREEKEVMFEKMSGSVLQMIVDYCYSGSIELHEDNVKELLEIASLLQLDALLTICAEFLVKSLHTSNCLGIALYVQQHNCTEIYRQAEAFIHQNYMQVCKSTEFSKLNFKQLCQLIVSDDIVVNSEVDVFNSCMSWLNHDHQKRETHFTELLALMRLPLMSPDFITDHIKPLCKSKKSKDLIIEALEWQCQPQRRSKLSSSRTRPRKSANESLLAIEKFSGDEFTLKSYNYNLNEWIDWMVQIPYLEYSVCAVLDNNLLVVGRSQVYSYDFEINAVTEQNGLNTPREFFRGDVLCGCLYIVGGRKVWSHDLLKSVERWDPQLRTWSYVAPMCVERSKLGVAVLGELLYAVGGCSSIAGSTVECYDPHTNKWTPRSPMNKSRSSFGIAAGNGYLYVVSGLEHYDVHTNTVERYDPLSDKWTMICSIGNARFNIDCTFLSNSLIAVGGCDNSSWLSTFAQYNIDTNKWIQRKPVPLLGIKADRIRVVKISKMFDQSLM